MISENIIGEYPVIFEGERIRIDDCVCGQPGEPFPIITES